MEEFQAILREVVAENSTILTDFAVSTAKASLLYQVISREFYFVFVTAR